MADDRTDTIAAMIAVTVLVLLAVCLRFLCRRGASRTPTIEGATPPVYRVQGGTTPGGARVARAYGSVSMPRTNVARRTWGEVTVSNALNDTAQGRNYREVLGVDNMGCDPPPYTEVSPPAPHPSVGGVESAPPAYDVAITLPQGPVLPGGHSTQDTTRLNR